MKVILTGGTGMVGSLLLELCLKSSQVDEIISFVRKPSGKESLQTRKNQPDHLISNTQNVLAYQ